MFFLFRPISLADMEKIVMRLELLAGIVRAEDVKPGAIVLDVGVSRKVDPETGKFETLYDSCDGRKLNGPNDLVFDDAGGFWFTDLGKTREHDNDRGAVYYAKADGSKIEQKVFPLERPNGCGLSPDEKTLYVVETPTARCWAFDLSAPGEIKDANGPYRGEKGRVIAGLGGYQMFDSLAVDSAGISVPWLRYRAVLLCGLFSGLAGAYIAIAQNAGFSRDMTAGQGFIALAAVIFGKWRPFPAFGACLMFGLLGAMIVFGRRAESAAYSRIEGQPGAATAALNTLPKGYLTTPAVAGNRQQDFVHRGLGPPGSVLVADGGSAGRSQTFAPAG